MARMIFAEARRFESSSTLVERALEQSGSELNILLRRVVNLVSANLGR
jgi:hypothetical protein